MKPSAAGCRLSASYGPGKGHLGPVGSEWGSSGSRGRALLDTAADFSSVVLFGACIEGVVLRDK